MKMKALLFTEWRAARRPGDEPIKRINSEAGALPFCHPGLSSRVPPPFALRCFGFALLCFALVSHLPSLAQSRLLLVLSRASQLVSLSSFVTAVLSSPFPISSPPKSCYHLSLSCLLSSHSVCSWFSCFSWNLARKSFFSLGRFSQKPCKRKKGRDRSIP